MQLSLARARVSFRRQSRLTRVFLVLLLLTALLWLADRLLQDAAASGTAVQGWLRLGILISAVLGSVVLVRWVRRRLMWRLRNRLVVTYMFIGVIPVFLLAVMALMTNYLFAGQFATFVASTALRAELRAVEGANTTVAAEVADQIRRERPLGRRRIQTPPGVTLPGAGFAEREITAWFEGRGVVLQSPRSGEAVPLSRPEWLGDQFSGVVYDGGRLYLRAAVSLPVGGEALTVISSLPVDEVLLGRVANGLGELFVIPADVRFEASPTPPADASEQGERRPGFRVRTRTESRAGTFLEFDQQAQGEPPQRARSITAGEVPPPASRWDREMFFATLLGVVEWQSGERANSVLQVRTRPSQLYHQLFLTVGEFGGLVVTALIGVAIFFAVIELLALLVGIRLTRTITRSVANLWEATERVNQGDLSHRIVVKSNDQLAALESSFNSMTSSLERLLEEQKEKERLQSELAIAQEVQAQLFPHQVDQLATLEVEGFCLPARMVSGDYYDFIRLGSDELVLALGDVSGKGISAALMMATLHSAVRAYEFGRVNEGVRRELAAVHAAGGSAPPPGGDGGNGGQGLQNPGRVLQLLNRHLYLSTPAEKYATLFLGLYDGSSRRLTYSNAGHLPPLLLRSDGSVHRLDCGGTVTGLFPELEYEERTIALQPGDLFLAYSDGVTEPENEYGEFGEHRMVDLVQANRDLPLPRILDLVTSAVHDWIGAQEQPDDLTLVLARVR